MLRIELMRTLVAVYDCGSVIGAARAQGYSAAAISRQIGKLQRQLGVQLFRPDGRGIAPTPAAADLVDRVRGILAHANLLEEYLKEIREQPTVVSVPV